MKNGGDVGVRQIAQKESSIAFWFFSQAGGTGMIVRPCLAE